MTWSLTLQTDTDDLADFIGEIADAISIQRGDDNALWTIDAYFEDKPNENIIAAQLELAAGALGIETPTYLLSKIDNTDWLAKTYSDFPPMVIGRFYIHGSHIKNKIPAALHGIQIDAAVAFGSGEHATTTACLRAISDLTRNKNFSRVLDMGCGSGILALAFARVSSCTAVGIDNDKPSVVVANENAAKNGLAARVKFGYGDGFCAPLMRNQNLGRKKFDAIAANILARPLMRMAPQMKRSIARNGTIILSGLLNSQENQVLSAYRAQNIYLKKRYRVNGWSALVLAAR